MTTDNTDDPAPVATTSQRPVRDVPEARLAEVFRRRDAAEWGIDPASVRTYIKQGLWTRLHRGVYANSAVLQSAREDPARLHHLLARAAVLALPIQAYALGPTASLTHGLPLPAGLPSVISLVRSGSADQRALHRRITHASALGAVQLHRHQLTEADVTEIDGLPTVTRDLAAITTAARCTTEWAVALLDAVSWQRENAARELGATVEQWAQLRGIGTVREALALSRSGAQSPFESLSRVRLVAQGLPEPRLQTAYYDDDGLIGNVDLDWDEWGVVGECDGALKYTNRDDLMREKRREDRLRALGLVVVRMTWPEMMASPEAVARRIWRARALAALSR